MSKEFERESTDEIWQRVARDIEHKIILGEYKPGERLPSIRELAAQYRTSIWTIQKAFEPLMKNGTITLKRGTGYYIKPFVQNELLTKHKMRLQKIIMETLLCGAEIGLTEEELLAPYRKQKGQ